MTLPPGLRPASATSTTSSDLERARGLLERYEPPDADRAEVREEMLRTLGLEGGIDRGLPAHLVASGMVVHLESRQALLISHPRFKRFQQPGGHLDGDTELQRVAVREVAEETGLDHLLLDEEILDLDRFAHGGDRDPRPHTHLDVRFLLVMDSPGEAPEVVSPEGDELRWFSLEELAEGSEDPSMRRLARAALERLEVHSR